MNRLQISATGAMEEAATGDDSHAYSASEAASERVDMARRLRLTVAKTRGDPQLLGPGAPGVTLNPLRLASPEHDHAAAPPPHADDSISRAARNAAGVSLRATTLDSGGNGYLHSRDRAGLVNRAAEEKSAQKTFRELMGLMRDVHLRGVEAERARRVSGHSACDAV